MSSEAILNAIDRQQWLDPVGERIQQAVHGAFESAGESGRNAKNALHGTWLGHPVHPALTDLPVGAWTVTVVCDALEEMTGQNGFGKASDVALTVGLAGAVGAAVTGLTDWSETDQRARRVGLLHGVINIGAALLFGTSLLCRTRKNRQLGRGLSSLGYLLALGSAYLGGDLVFNEQVGVNHTAGGPPLPEKFVPVGSAADLGEGQMRKADVSGIPVLLARVDGQICAIHDTCSHAGGPLDEGKLEGHAVTCPWHGSTFDVRSGKVLNGPATYPQPCFEARVHDGSIEVRRARPHRTTAADSRVLASDKRQLALEGLGESQ